MIPRELPFRPHSASAHPIPTTLGKRRRDATPITSTFKTGALTLIVLNSAMFYVVALALITASRTENALLDELIPYLSLRRQSWVELAALGFVCEPVGDLWDRQKLCLLEPGDGSLAKITLFTLDDVVDGVTISFYQGAAEVDDLIAALGQPRITRSLHVTRFLWPRHSLVGYAGNDDATGIWRSPPSQMTLYSLSRVIR